MPKSIDLTQYDYIWRVNDIPVYSRVDLEHDEVDSIVKAQCKRVLRRPDYIIIDTEDDWLVSAPFFNDAQNFERIRRITGYLVGSLDRFNDGKRAEESERVKHKVDHG